MEENNKKKKRKRKDLTGKQFTRWKVLYETKQMQNNRYWVCECSCGNHTRKTVAQSALISGKSKSCGCLHKEIMQQIRNKKQT